MTEIATIVVSVVLSGLVSFLLAWYKTNAEMKKQIKSYKLEQENYYDRIKYDTEFQALRELTEKMNSATQKCFFILNELGEDYVQKKDTYLSRIGTFNEAMELTNDFAICRNNNAPFINKEISNKMSQVIELCYKIGKSYIDNDISELPIDRAFENLVLLLGEIADDIKHHPTSHTIANLT